jgi:hypothetical protein
VAQHRARAQPPSVDEVEHAVRLSWRRDTSDEPEAWWSGNPARGQCAATALVVRDWLGGVLLRADVLRAGAPVQVHYWNRLPSGRQVDLTSEQFGPEEVVGPPTVLSPSRRPPEDAARRYDLLAARVRERLREVP